MTVDQWEAIMAGAQTVRQEIEEQNRAFVAAFKRGDAAGVAAAYLEDARLLPPGGQAVNGRDAIRQFWQSVMDQGVREVDLRTEYAEGEGDPAYEIGSATLLSRPADGAERTDTVKYVVAWKRQEGSTWRQVADIIVERWPKKYEEEPV
jgi:uncharacterized protein (TIGR02246 family)